MSTGVGSGDKLARGANKATYSTTEGGVTQDKWAAMFDNYNPEEFRNAPNKSSQRAEVGSGDSDVPTSGDVGIDVGEAGPEPTTR